MISRRENQRCSKGSSDIIGSSGLCLCHPVRMMVIIVVICRSSSVQSNDDQYCLVWTILAVLVRPDWLFYQDGGSRGCSRSGSAPAFFLWSLSQTGQPWMQWGTTQPCRDVFTLWECPPDWSCLKQGGFKGDSRGKLLLHDPEPLHSDLLCGTEKVVLQESRSTFLCLQLALVASRHIQHGSLMWVQVKPRLWACGGLEETHPPTAAVCHGAEQSSSLSDRRGRTGLALLNKQTLEEL